MTNSHQLAETMSITRRALRPDQKQRRRDAILAAALARFADTSYEALIMDDIAADVGVAKGTLYLYFHSKQELFLALYQRELSLWFDELDNQLQQNRSSASFESVLQLLGESLQRRPEFLRLMAILHTVLERNLDFHAALNFKQAFKQRILHSGGLLEASLPFLKPGQGAELLLKINALAIGFEHLAEPSKVMTEVLQQPEMSLFRMDLTQQLLDTLRLLLMGLAYQAKYGSEK